MKRIVFIIGLISLIEFSQGQDIKVLEPTIEAELDFSPDFIAKFNSKEAFEDCEKVWNKVKAEGRDYNSLTKEEKEIIKYCDEIREDVWDIIGSGCGWYCGGGPKEVSASSYLKSQGENNYEPKNAHDLNYKNVWVEGVDGYGIGEYLLYTFDGVSPRINEIIVVNGYVKSKSAWENNSRVKKLKVYIDDKPYAILNLKDIRGSQSFKVDPIGNSDRTDWDLLKMKPDWTLKFEILDVYKGLKYDDVVISEIYFDGIDVHCFAKGTKIQLADNSTKNIEDLNVGDLVAYMNFDTKTIKSAKIEKTEKVIHHGLVNYGFESGLTITATQDHPFKIDNKGWASLKPDKSIQYKGFESIEKIKIGDLFLTANGTEKLVSIEYLKGEQETYTISKLSSGDNFIANGLIVGVEGLND
jgi:hypothetical protein